MQTPTLRRPAPLLAILALVAAASSCAAPLQNGGVEMRPGVEERLGLLCRYRPAASDAQHVCAAPEAPEGEE